MRSESTVNVIPPDMMTSPASVECYVYIMRLHLQLREWSCSASGLVYMVTRRAFSENKCKIKCILSLSSHHSLFEHAYLHVATVFWCAKVSNGGSHTSKNEINTPLLSIFCITIVCMSGGIHTLPVRPLRIMLNT